jgi:hypothetical protein
MSLIVNQIAARFSVDAADLQRALDVFAEKAPQSELLLTAILGSPHIDPAKVSRSADVATAAASLTIDPTILAIIVAVLGLLAPTLGPQILAWLQEILPNIFPPT